MVVRVGSVGGGLAPPRRAGRAGGGFMLPGARDAAATAASAGAGSVSALMLLQGTAPTEPVEARAARRARAALEDLRGLQLDLLRGAEDPARLQRLAALAESEALPADPVLREAASAIALRARIELARRRRAVS